VKSQADGEIEYCVTLDGWANCDCYSCSWWLLPCKHIFAVLDTIPGLSWSSLAEDYRECVFFVLDTEVSGFLGYSDLDGTNPDGHQLHQPAKDADHENDIGDSALPSNRRGPSTLLKSNAVLCREKLSILHSHTFLCQDVSALQHVAGLLQDTQDYLISHIHQESGLVPQPPPPHSHKKRQLRASDTGHRPAQEALRGYRRRGKSRRVGVSAERRAATILPPMETVMSAQDVSCVEDDGHTSLPEDIIRTSRDANAPLLVRVRPPTIPAQSAVSVTGKGN
jgi:hypothetical protein